MHPLYLCDHTAPTAIFTLSLHDALPISGLPDGFRVDSDGNLWSSSLTGIQVFTPAGEKLGEIPVPEKVANCCFGGADGRTLYICATTRSEERRGGQGSRDEVGGGVWT